MATNKKNNVSKTKKVNNKGNVSKNSLREEKNKIEQINSGFDSNIWHYVKVISCVIIFICLFYLLTLYITSKNSNENTDTNTKEESTDTISYSDIMVGRSFSISDGEYFVIYYDKSDETVNSSCSSAVSSYQSKDEHLDIYTADMSDGFNKKYAKDESNSNPTSASEIAISGPTLIKFSDGKVVEYIEGKDEIVEYLQ